MNTYTTDNTSKILLHGIGLELTNTMKRFATEKAARLFRHNHHIIRVRMELAMEINKVRAPAFIALGILELPGPDIVVSARSGNAYAAIEKMITILDRKLRHRHWLRILKRARPRGIEFPATLPKLPPS